MFTIESYSKLIPSKKLSFKEFKDKLSPLKVNFEYKINDNVTRNVDFVDEDTIYNFAKSIDDSFQTLLDFAFIDDDEITKIGLILPDDSIHVAKVEKWTKINDFKEKVKLQSASYFPKLIKKFHKSKIVVGRPVGDMNSKFIGDPIQINPKTKLVENSKYKKIYFHSSHNNLANIYALIEYKKELEIAKKMNCLGYVVHTGSNDVKLLKRNLIELSKYATESCPILLETSAGQGNQNLKDIDSFINFYDELEEYKDKIKICFDTCHVFVAGNKVYESLLKFDHNDIKLVHLNDSVQPFKSRIDRHREIGLGFIGMKILNKVIKYCIEFDIDMIEEI